MSCFLKCAIKVESVFLVEHLNCLVVGLFAATEDSRVYLSRVLDFKCSREIQGRWLVPEKLLIYEGTYF